MRRSGFVVTLENINFISTDRYVPSHSLQLLLAFCSSSMFVLMHSGVRTAYKLCTCTCMYAVFKRRPCDINSQCRSSIYFACRRKGCLRVCAVLVQSLFVFCAVSLTRSYWQSFTWSANCSYVGMSGQRAGQMECPGGQQEMMIRLAES